MTLTIAYMHQSLIDDGTAKGATTGDELLSWKAIYNRSIYLKRQVRYGHSRDCEAPDLLELVRIPPTPLISGEFSPWANYFERIGQDRFIRFPSAKFNAQSVEKIWPQIYQ